MTEDRSMDLEPRLLREALHALAGVWVLPILNTLADGPLRFAQIRHRLHGISEQMLSSTLTRLQDRGLVTRHEVLDSTSYALTALARRSLVAAAAFSKVAPDIYLAVHGREYRPSGQTGER